MFKQKVKEVLTGVWNTAKTMPVTLILIFIATLLATVFVDDGFEIEYEIIGWIILGLGFTAVGAFFAETGFSVKNPLRYITIVLVAGLSVFFVWVLDRNPFDYTSSYMDRYFLPRVIGYVLLMIVLSVWNCYRNSKEALNTYVAGVFINFLLTGVVLGILTGGVMMLILIFNVLITECDRLFIWAIILVFGLVTVPAYLIALQNVKEQKGKFPRVLIAYIMCPIVAAAYLIIYLYMAKILIARAIPSNEIFAILAGIFAAGAPVFLMTEAVSDAPVFKKGIRILYFLYLPFVLLQVYSLGSRVMQYGITPSRYLGMLIIAVELIWLLISIIRPAKRGLIFPVLALCVLILLVLPFSDFNTVSIASQNRAIRAYQADPNPETARKAYGALDYLDDVPEQVKTAVSGMTDEERKAFRQELIELKEEGGQVLEPEDSYRWFNFTVFNGAESYVDVSAYRGITAVSASQSFYDAESEAEALEQLAQIEVSDRNSDSFIMVDGMDEYLEWYFDYVRSKYEFDDPDTYYDYGTYTAPKEHRVIPIDSEHDLYICSMEISGKREGDELIPDYLWIEGWVLVK